MNEQNDFPFLKDQRSSFWTSFYYSRTTLNTKNRNSTPDWQPIGPTNIGGRTLSLALNPLDTNELWMGSASGGLWHSSTGGMGTKAWNYIKTGYPVLGVHAIAIHPKNPDILYIGTGEIYNYSGSNGGIYERTLRGSWGIGILKSVDHGKSWSHILDWSMKPFQGVFEIILDPKNPSTVYAATTHGVWKSFDDGENWEKILDLPMASDILLDPKQPNIIYAGIGGIGATTYGVYQSIDYGKNWNRIDSRFNQQYQGRIMLHAYVTNPSKVYVAFSDKFSSLGIMRTLDHFKTTKFQTDIPDVCQYQGWYAKCLHVHDMDSTKLIMGGVDLYRDTSGTGNQLISVILNGTKIHADMHDIISNPLDPNKIYIATDGGLYRSFDYGKQFISCNGGYQTSQFYSGNFSRNKTDMAIGGMQDNRSAIYDGSTQWKAVSLGDGCYNGIHSDSTHILYTSIQYGALYKSTNGGQQWTSMLAGDGQAAFVAPFDMNISNSNYVYVGTTTLNTSSNAGKSWSTIPLPYSQSIINAISSLETDCKFIVYSVIDKGNGKLHLFKSNDGGQNSIEIGIGIPNRYIRKILISSKEKITIALGGYGTAHLIESNDGGITFKDLGRNLPDYPIHTVIKDPKDSLIVYVGSDLGIFMSQNGGLDFESYNNHPYDIVQVYDLKISYNDNQLAVFTHGHGAFKVKFHKRITDAKNVTDKKFLYFYPNPAQSEGQIYFSHIGNEIVKLLATDGKVYSIQITNGMAHLPKLPSGLYYLKLQISNELQKIMIE